MVVVAAEEADTAEVAALERIDRDSDADEAVEPAVDGVERGFVVAGTVVACEAQRGGQEEEHAHCTAAAENPDCGGKDEEEEGVVTESA